AGRLRQLADSDELVGIQPAHAVDQLVADRRPGLARGAAPYMVAHLARDRGKNRDIHAAVAHGFRLGALQALADFAVADDGRSLGRERRILERVGLALAPVPQRLGGGSVVPVAVDDHRIGPLSRAPASSRRTGPRA